MRERFVVERSCDHGNFGACGHQELSATGKCAVWGCDIPNHACAGGSRFVAAYDHEIPSVVRDYLALEDYP